jgi:creatinine amidohydrolase/Fe(II)-dependent formamide hydrolase-like protein
LALEPNGVSGDPMKASAERGRALLDIKVAAAVRQIKALAGGM